MQPKEGLELQKGVNWQKEFYKNVDSFVEAGLSPEEARDILITYLRLTAELPPPQVLKIFEDEKLLDKIGTYTPRKEEVRDFMLSFLKPLLYRFQIKGLENLDLLKPLVGKFPITFVANHLSHFDAAAIYGLLYLSGGWAREVAERLLFIAGRLVFLPTFTRPGIYMFPSLLVCSRRDMTENPGLADLMLKINQRTFREAQKRQKKGEILVVFPEGTRSRTGKLLQFVDAVYHYVANRIVVPISIQGTEKLLPPNSFVFQLARGEITIGKPLVIGNPPGEDKEELKKLQNIDVPKGRDKKRYIIDMLALLIGQNLSKHMHGAYRNLYKKDGTLIQIPSSPRARIGVIGHSRLGIAVATFLALQDTLIYVYIKDPERAQIFQKERVDTEFFPLFKLPPNIEFSSDPEVLKEKDLYIQAVYPWEIKDYYPKILPFLSSSSSPIVNVVKGFVESSYPLILDTLEKEFSLDPARLGVLAGASWPEQIMERKPSLLELACINTSLVDSLLPLFNTHYISTRAAINPYDVKGVQLGGALKNVYALGIGFLDGYLEEYWGGNNDNTLFYMAKLMFQEMIKLGSFLGAKKNTFSGVSGYADFMLTAFGQEARDRHYGFEYMKGEKLKKPLPSLTGIKVLRKLLPDERKEEFPILSYISQILENPQDRFLIAEEWIEKIR